VIELNRDSDIVNGQVAGEYFSATLTF